MFNSKEEKPIGEKILTGAAIYVLGHLILGPVGGAIVSIVLGDGDGDC